MRRLGSDDTSSALPILLHRSHGLNVVVSRRIASTGAFRAGFNESHSPKLKTNIRGKIHSVVRTRGQPLLRRPLLAPGVVSCIAAIPTLVAPCPTYNASSEPLPSKPSADDSSSCSLISLCQRLPSRLRSIECTMAEHGVAGVWLT